jgi:transcription-repair coupling factor (superfamily II helicase)
LPSKQTWREAQLHWEVGGEIDLDSLAQQLVLMGYERQSLVGKPGDFSIRGSIIDVYPLNAEYPVRAELFDIEIDSLRYFEADTQRSVAPIDQVTLSPMTDLIFSAADLAHGEKQLEKALEKRVAIAKDAAEKDFLQEYFGQLSTSWNQGLPTDTAHYYTDLLYKEKNNVA